jgi:hypothetical protein
VKSDARVSLSELHPNERGTISGIGLIEPLLDQTVRIPKAVVTPGGYSEGWNASSFTFSIGGVALAA